MDAEALPLLPPVLRGVVRALGFARAAEWLALYGGVNIVVPRYRASAIGLSAEELARLRKNLARHLDAQGRIWMPKADKLMIHVRNQVIRHERPHASIRVLARRYNLSSRQIVNICRDIDEVQAQGRLF
jgi:Mor family transcriptional regulator